MITLAMSLCMVMTLNALELTVTPGSLAENKLELQYTQDSKLVLKGDANSADLEVLREMSQNVTELDMEGLRIDNGEFPAYMAIGTRLASIKFPKQLKAIGYSCFAATDFATMEIPASVERIDAYAFSACKNLKSVKISNNTELGEGLFRDCTALEDATFGPWITKIPAHMFDGCTGYEGTIPSTVIEIGDCAYRATAKRSITLMNVTKIGEYAFANMKLLNNVTLPRTGVQIGKGAFFNDGSLADLPIWTGEMASGVYSHATGILQERINNDVIKAGAFANNPNITNVTLGSDVNTIEAHAFRNLTALKSVNVLALQANVPEVDPEAFSGLTNESGRYNIVLEAKKDTHNVWKAHPVWGLFEIQDPGTVVDNFALDFELNVNRRKDMIKVASTLSIDHIAVYSIDGICIYEAAPNTTDLNISDMPAEEVLVVSVSCGNTTKVKKLL